PSWRLRLLADRELEVERLAGPPERKFHRRAHAVGPQEAHEMGDAAERFAVPCDDDVALPDAGGRARALGVDADRHQSDTPAFELHRLQAETQIAARDPALGGER